MRYFKIVAAIIIVALSVFCAYVIWLGMDSDGDGLTNGAEVGGWDIVIYLADGQIKEKHVTSDSGKIDTDGDGLTDYEEFSHVGMLDPKSKDTDGDGIDDYKEVVVSGTLPNKQDTDGDGLFDGIEVNGWNITVEDKVEHVTSNPMLKNTDGDELDDCDEWNGSIGFKTNPSKKDTDGDGVTDGTDQNPVHNIKLRLRLLNFTLLSSPKGISIPYFCFVVSNCTVKTEKLDPMEEGESFEFDEGFSYILDVSDYKGDFPVRMLLTAFDNNSQEEHLTAFGSFKIDKSLCINGSQVIWSGYYTNYPDNQTFIASGDDGILRFEISVS